MTDKYLIPASELERVYPRISAEIDEMGRAFEALNKAQKEHLTKVTNPIIQRVDQREVRIDQDLISDEEVGMEQDEEAEELLPHLEAAFPFVANGTQERKDACVIAFLEYMGRKLRAN